MRPCIVYLLLRHENKLFLLSSASWKNFVVKCTNVQGSTMLRIVDATQIHNEHAALTDSSRTVISVTNISELL